MSRRQPTRQKLLNILKKDSSLTIDEIMTYFSISEIAVRKHLHELERQGLVGKKAIKQKIGRPYFTYSLTKAGHDTFPNQYEQLPLELLKDLEALHGEEMVEALLDKRMKRDKAHFEKELQSDDFDEKMNAVAKIQDDKGYMVEMEKTETGDYELKHFNCPIANIASSYQQICHNEKTVFEEIFKGSKVISHSCITKGDHFCKWTITRPDK